MTVRLNGSLSDFVAANVGAQGAYDSVSADIRDLIRRDMKHASVRAVQERLYDITTDVESAE